MRTEEATVALQDSLHVEQSLNAASFTNKVWYGMVLPMSTLLFEQPPWDAATPLIHAEEAGWRKKRHALQARLN